MVIVFYVMIAGGLDQMKTVTYARSADLIDWSI